MPAPHHIALLAAALFFFFGLVTGIWKYAEIRRSPQAEPPAYVALTHRAFFMYAFANLLIAELAELSRLPSSLEYAAIGTLLLFFIVTLVGYALHGWLRDTDNQFRRPYRMGELRISANTMHSFMTALIIGEGAAFSLLFFGAAKTILAH